MLAIFHSMILSIFYISLLYALAENETFCMKILQCDKVKMSRGGILFTFAQKLIIITIITIIITIIIIIIIIITIIIIIVTMMMMMVMMMMMMVMMMKKKKRIERKELEG